MAFNVTDMQHFSLNDCSFFNPRRQAFAFPYNSSNYITKNSSPNVYSKLIMTCKQYFSKKHVLVAEKVTFICLRFNASLGDPMVYFTPEKLKACNVKLWITELLLCNVVFTLNQQVSNFLNHLYRFDGKKLELLKQE